MSRSVLTTLAVCALLAAVSSAADLPTSVTGLASAIAVRNATLAASPSTSTREETREADRLARTTRVLTEYAGGLERSDFRLVGKAGKLVAASRTSDPTVLEATHLLLKALGSAAEAAAGPAEDVMGLLTEEMYRAKVAALHARASTLLDLGRDRADEDPARAGKLLYKARRTWLRAAARGEEYLARGGGKFPPGVTVRKGILWIENRSMDRYYLQDVQVTGAFRNEETGFVSLTASGVSMRQGHLTGLLPGTIEGAAVADPTPALHRLDDYLQEFRWRLTPVASYTTVPHRFEGTLVLSVSNRLNAKPGKRALWHLVIER